MDQVRKEFINYTGTAGFLNRMPNKSINNGVVIAQGNPSISTAWEYAGYKYMIANNGTASVKQCGVVAPYVQCANMPY